MADGQVQTLPYTGAAQQAGVFDPWANDALAKFKQEGQAELERTQNKIEANNRKIQELQAQGSGEWVHYRNENVHLQNHARDMKLKAEGMERDGSPFKPEFHSLIDPSTGKLHQQYQANIAGLDPASWEAYQKYRTEGLREAGALSPWAKLQMEKQAAEQAQARDQAARQAMTAQSQAMSQLAMRGGLGGGARTSLAKGLGRDLLTQRQATARQGIMERLGISSEDERSRQQALQSLAGTEADIGKYNKQLEAQQTQFNLQNLLRDVEGRRAYEMGTYSEQMKKWAAERQAQATERSGGGGGK